MKIEPSYIGPAVVDILRPLNPRVGAEVGVFRADTSRSLLQAFPELNLYLVDSWKRVGKKRRDIWHKIAMENIAGFGNRSAILHGESVNMAEKIKDGELDFVFIDADHSYRAVLADIKAWETKVRNGGWVLGHDYANPRQSGVKQVVDEYFGTVEVYSDGGRGNRVNDKWVDCKIWLYRK